MNKFLKFFLALGMSASLTCMTACDVLGGSIGGNGGNNGGNTDVNAPSNGDDNDNVNNGGENNNGSGSGNEENGGNSGNQGDDSKPSAVKSSVSLVLNGGSSAALTEYTEGVAATLPVPTREHFVFKGWYENELFSGQAVTAIPTTAKGDKTYYAKWSPEEYTITYYIDGAVVADIGLSKYGFGGECVLPKPEKTNYTFNGWYAKSDLSGNKLNKIEVGEFGNKTYYGEWIASDELQLTSYGGYEEGAYVELNTVNGVSSYTVEYKAKGASAYTRVDSQLVRVSGNTVRADIVGLAAGTYTVRTTAGKKTVEKDVEVTAYDRSGYAHFKASEGVGGYNADGTPKDGAYIVYVNEENKNKVVAPWNSKITGIVALLGDAKNADKPVIVRVLGTVGAATWSADNWAKLKVKYDAAKGSASKIANDSSIVGINDKALPKKSMTQAELILGGYNALDKTKYDELNGLVSKTTYKSSSSESGFDSYWNNCEISDASNVTVEGIGTDAQIVQWGFTWKKCNSIEVRNLTFDDYTEDACSFEGSTDDKTYTGATVDKFNSKRLWVHHNTFNQGMNYWDVCAEQDKREGDGATDFKRCSYVTVAYNHYFNNHKTGLVGSDDNVFTANVTFHHNFYDQCQSRLPLARQANMHMYNNYYYKSSGTNMSIRSGAYAFVEYCYFDNAKNPIQTQLGKKEVNVGGQNVKLDGYAKVFNCTFDETQLDSKYKLDTTENNVTIVTDRTQTVENDNIYYENFDTDASGFYYKNGASNVEKLITDVETLPAVIPQLAGVHKNK